MGTGREVLVRAALSPGRTAPFMCDTPRAAAPDGRRPACRAHRGRAVHATACRVLGPMAFGRKLDRAPWARPGCTASDVRSPWHLSRLPDLRDTAPLYHGDGRANRMRRTAPRHSARSDAPLGDHDGPTPGTAEMTSHVVLPASSHVACSAPESSPTRASTRRVAAASSVAQRAISASECIAADAPR